MTTNSAPMLPTPGRVYGIFFKAVQAGYASSTPKSTISELPSSKVITYENGDWLVKDVYFVNKTNQMSFGTTTIWYQGQPVWFMNYHGWYDEKVTPFLKKVLRETYAKSAWHGGRGPAFEFSDDRLYKYRNKVEQSDFEKFCGMEEIIDENNAQWGWHQYEGQLLRRP